MRAQITPALVVHVMDNADGRSAAQARIVEGLASLLDHASYRVAALFLGDDGPLTAELSAQGVATSSTPFRRVSDLPGALRLARHSRELDPAIVHLHLGGRSRIGLFRITTSARVVAHLHSAVDATGDALDLERASRGAHELVATSAAVAARVERKTEVIRPGVAIPALQGAGRDPSLQVIGTVARLVPVKGLDWFLHALPILRDNHPGTRAEVAGSGPLEPELRELAARLGVADLVTFLGWREDIAALHRRWDVYVQPSRYEGLGIAALEAMASGLPVVAFDTGGLPELISDGETGYLVPRGDVARLAGRVGELLIEPSRRASFGRAARRRAEQHFSLNRMAADVGALYQRLLAR